MTKSSRGLILYAVSELNADNINIHKKIPVPIYIEKMMALDSVICYKCMEEIDVGTKYTHITHKAHGQNKYYHSGCHESMYY